MKRRTSISYSTKYYIQNKYFLNISYYKTHQQNITYKISIFYYVRDFCLVYIYFFYFVSVVKRHEYYLFISFLVCQQLNISKYLFLCSDRHALLLIRAWNLPQRDACILGLDWACYCNTDGVSFTHYCAKQVPCDNQAYVCLSYFVVAWQQQRRQRQQRKQQQQCPSMSLVVLIQDTIYYLIIVIYYSGIFM